MLLGLVRLTFKMEWLSFGILVLVLICEVKSKVKYASKENERPIVGILSQEMSVYLNGLYPGMYESYIAASYVKFIEGAGARVVPIRIGKDRAYYEDIMGKINGVLFPGGASCFNKTNGYADAGEHIYKIAKDLNDHGDYFPLWGTCLGFELLSYLSDNRNEHRAVCSSEKQSLNLDFKNDFRTSELFKDAPNEVVSILSDEKVTSNFHTFCITEDILSKFTNDWRVLSVNDDVNGLTFVSAMESQKYPFFGIQFHPEKNIYEWVLNKNISHTPRAIKANSYFAEYFVGLARENNHTFSDVNEENSKLIYNYELEYTGIKGSAYEQIYVFKFQNGRKQIPSVSLLGTPSRGRSPP